LARLSWARTQFAHLTLPLKYSVRECGRCLSVMRCICAHRVLKIERSGAVHLPPIYHSDNQTKLHARDVVILSHATFSSPFSTVRQQPLTYEFYLVMECPPGTGMEVLAVVPVRYPWPSLSGGHFVKTYART
jgi:hypothetical protein